jgi:hypothetical protein
MMAAAAPGRRARASPPAASLSLSMHLGGRSGFQVLVHWQLDSRRRLSLVAWRRGPARRRRPRADGRGRGIPLAVGSVPRPSVSQPGLSGGRGFPAALRLPWKLTRTPGRLLAPGPAPCR